MQLYFDVQHLYYIPQYLPVLKELKAKGYKVSMVFYEEQDERSRAVCRDFIDKNAIVAEWLTNTNETFDFYQNSDADWVVFGNTFAGAEDLN